MHQPTHLRDGASASITCLSRSEEERDPTESGWLGSRNMAHAAVDQPSAVRRVYWDRAATIVTVVLAAITVVILVGLSGIHPRLLMVIAALILPYALGLIWLFLIVRAIQRRRIWAPLVVIPVVIALLATATSTEFPAELRWNLSRPSMNAYVQSLPSPPPPLIREPTQSEIETYDTTFRGACPSMLGTYSIVECRAIPGGYMFLTSVEDNGEGTGVAYLPLTESSRDWSLQVSDNWISVGSWPLEEPWYAILIQDS